ncbi:MAG: MerR family transcriptional regulator [bacterium]|nr:MerR family transcriptional regulator [bacterium]
MFTIGDLARRCRLSRSTLLYYDSIGLLRPSARTPAGYRQYDEDALSRLRRICGYRDVGLKLTEIKNILDGTRGRTAEVLEGRLESLNDEICRLREQQRVIVGLLRNRSKLRGARALDKERWVALLRATGLDDDDMRRWHVEFERMSPQGHRDFLQSLGIPEREIRRIRDWSRSAAGSSEQR